MGVLLRGVDGLAPAPQSRGHLALIGAAASLAVLVMTVRRVPGLTHPWFWAEDGAIFFVQNATGTGGPFTPYVWQMWLLPRVTAGLLGVFSDPITTAAAYYLAAAAISALMLCVVLARRCEPVFGSLPWRVVAVGFLVLLPGVAEIQGNLANLHVWGATAALVCLRCPEPSTPLGKVAEGALLILTSLSGFTAVVLLPVVIWSAWRFPTPRSRARCALVSAAGALAVILGHGRSVPLERSLGQLDSLPLVLTQRVGSTLMHGEAFVATGVWQVLAGVLLLAVVSLAVLDWKGPSLAWLLAALIWPVLGAVSLGSVEVLRAPFAAGRYFPLLLSVCVLVLIRAAALPDRALPLRRLRRPLAAGCLCLVAFGAVRDARLPANPPLTADEADAFQQCLTDGRDDCSIPSQPLGW